MNMRRASFSPQLPHGDDTRIFSVDGAVNLIIPSLRLPVGNQFLPTLLVEEGSGLFVGIELLEVRFPRIRISVVSPDIEPARAISIENRLLASVIVQKREIGGSLLSEPVLVEVAFSAADEHEFPTEFGLRHIPIGTVLATDDQVTEAIREAHRLSPKPYLQDQYGLASRV